MAGRKKRKDERNIPAVATDHMYTVDSAEKSGREKKRGRKGKRGIHDMCHNPGKRRKATENWLIADYGLWTTDYGL